MSTMDNPTVNDNRQYRYTAEMYMRAEFPIISGWIPAGSSVLDLGCGNGAFMKYLEDHNTVTVRGIDNSVSGIEIARAHNLSAQVGEIDSAAAYAEYKDKQFDYAVCNVTVQMVLYPEVLIEQMKRVASQLIISFPNFGYITNRLDLLLGGVMPRPMLHGYTWYNTGHIHQLSTKDFIQFCKKERLKIHDVHHLGGFMSVAPLYPTLLAKESIFLCEPR